MASQSGKNIQVAMRVETAFNTAVTTATGFTQIRLTGSPGLSQKKALINSAEVRSDGLHTIARHGSQHIEGSFNGEMSVGGHDKIYEAAMRGTWATATTFTQAGSASLVSVAASVSNVINFGGGSIITQGLRVGDIFRITGSTLALAVNLRAKTVAAASVQCYGAPFAAIATATTTFTMTILRKLINPATPTKRSFKVEKYNTDIDLSQQFNGVKWTGFAIKGTPEGMAEVTFNALGASVSMIATAASPTFSSPTLPTGAPLVFADAVISQNGVDLAVATAFDLTYALTAKTEPVVGTSFSPDVFDNDASLEGTISVIRQDLANFTAFNAESTFDLHILLTVPGTAPLDCISIFVPYCKFTDVTGPLGADGAIIDTMKWTAGKKEGFSTTGYDDTLLTICTSAVGT